MYQLQFCIVCCEIFLQTIWEGWMSLERSVSWSPARLIPFTGYGLKVHIPQGALPVGLKQCELVIKVGISVQFAFPQNTSLVSAVYWFHSEYQCEFSQPIIVELQHCAASSQTSRPRFAWCSDYSLPYNFEILHEGNFSHGRIQLCNLSLITVLKSLPLLTWIFGADDVKYYASVYYLWSGEKVFFLLCWSYYYYVIITVSYKGVWWQRCHNWTTPTSWVWSK